MVAEDEIAEALKNKEDEPQEGQKVSENQENDDLFSDEDDEDLF